METTTTTWLADPSVRPWPRPEAVLFDLDGTLVHTVPDLARAVDGALAAEGLPPAGPEKVAVWVGNGMDSLIHRALTGRMDGQAEPALHARAKARFYALYEANVCVESRLYDGARACLEALRAERLPTAIVTNKPLGFTVQLVHALGLAGLIGTIVGGDSVPRKKPDPMPLRHALDNLFLRADARTLFVGDSVNDVRAARNAGFPVVCTDYGYNHGQDIRDAEPDLVVPSLAELPALIGL